jgi:hypothetical protein
MFIGFFSFLRGTPAMIQEMEADPKKPKDLNSDLRALSYRIAIFFHPDYTVGIGITPNQLPCGSSRTVTASGDFHPALKTL